MSSSSSSSKNGTYQAIQIVKLQPTMAAGIENLALNELPRPKLEHDEVRVQVHASALNYFDLLMLQGRYQYRPALPFTAGSEAAGVVIEIGSEVKQWKLGDAVVVGMSMGDSLASEMVVNEKRLFRKAPQMSFAEACALPVGFFTAYHGLVQRGNIKKGETLLVTGAGGGMGLSAVQVGLSLGCRVIAAASTDQKCAAAKAAGAHHTVNYSNLKTLKGQVAKLTGGKGADVIYEVVGGEIAKECIRCIAPNGRFLVVGFAGGEIPSVPLNMVLVKGFSLVGVRSGQEMVDHPELTEEMLVELNKIAENGKDRTLAPAVVTKPLNQFRDAYSLIMNREIIGKAVVLWQPEKAKL